MVVLVAAGDALKFGADPRKGCRCGQPNCKVAIPNPHRPSTYRLSVDVNTLAKTQQFDPKDAAAIGAAAYRAASQGHVRVAPDAKEAWGNRPEFIVAGGPGREIFVPTHGMRDVHELVSTVGEVLAEQARASKVEAYKAMRAEMKQDIVLAHKEFNQALLDLRKANPRTIRERQNPLRPVKGQSQVYVGDRRGSQALQR